MFLIPPPLSNLSPRLARRSLEAATFEDVVVKAVGRRCMMMMLLRSAAVKETSPFFWFYRFFSVIRDIFCNFQFLQFYELNQVILYV